jgi:cytochrome c-type biogenesis protein CcmH/NrfG
VAALRYSSVAAFLAHLRALDTATARTEEDERILTVMRDALVELTSSEREALSSDSNASPTRRRHRERAKLKLSRALTARGLLAS